MARLKGRATSRRQDGRLIVVPAMMAVVIPAMVVAVVVVAVFNDHYLIDVDDRRRSRDGCRGRGGGTRAGGCKPGQTRNRHAEKQKVLHGIKRITRSKTIRA